jgi:hypothetical protein
VKPHVLVLSGLGHVKEEYGVGSHEGGTAFFLTGFRDPSAKKATSLDQMIGLKAGTRRTALNLTLMPGYYLADYKDTNGDGFAEPKTDAYDDSRLVNDTSSRAVISYRDGVAAANVYNPRLIFDELFASATGGGGGSGPAGDPLALTANRYRQSVLDAVAGDARKLQLQLGMADRARLDQYLTGVREIEQQIQREEKERLQPLPSTGECAPGARPPGIPMDRTARARLMMDLTVKAFECDATRAATLMLAQTVGGLAWTFDGVTMDGHDASHFGSEPANATQAKGLFKVKIDQWQVAQFAYFVQKLGATPDTAGSTLLDNSLVYYSSDLGHGDTHDQKDMPVLLAGSAGGLVRGGRHVVDAGGLYTCNLFLAISRAFGLSATSFGERGTSPLAGLS